MTDLPIKSYLYLLGKQEAEEGFPAFNFRYEKLNREYRDQLNSLLDGKRKASDRLDKLIGTEEWPSRHRSVTESYDADIRHLEEVYKEKRQALKEELEEIMPLAYESAFQSIIDLLPRIPKTNNPAFSCSMREITAISDLHLYSLCDMNSPFRMRSHIDKPYKGDYMDLVPDCFKTYFKQNALFSIPDRLRPQHCHIVGPSGSGKTQLIQKLVLDDLDTDATIIVMAPKGKLIPNLTSLASIDPDRIILIRPEDDIALNVFDLGLEGDIENAVEMVEYIFASILETDPSRKQTVVLNRLTRLLLTRKGSTILDLRKLLKCKEIPEDYHPYINKLNANAQEFFYEEYNRGDKEGYKDTKEQILWRIDLLLENPVIANIFSQPYPRFNLFQEIEKGKVILIDTSIKKLSQKGSAFMGRFFIAMVALASQQRDLDSNLRNVYFYVDEAATYLDERIEVILERAREAKIGLTLAHQQMEQLTKISPQLKASVVENTATKFMAKEEALQFSLSVRGMLRQPVTITVEGGLLESQPTRDPAKLIAHNREKYGAQIHVVDANEVAYAKHEPAPILKVAENDDDDLESLNKI